MKVAFVVFDRMTSLDFIGFYDPVTRLKSMKILDDFQWRICSTVPHVVDDRGVICAEGGANKNTAQRQPEGDWP